MMKRGLLMEMGLFEMPVWFFIITGIPIVLMTWLFLRVVIKTWKICNLEEMKDEEIEGNLSKESFYDHKKADAA